MSKEAYISDLREGIIQLHNAGNSITLIHHNDADGLSSGAIMQTALLRAGFSVRRIPLERVHPPIVARLYEQATTSAIVFVDLGGKAAPVISDKNRDRRFTLIIDHHLPEPSSNPQVLNLTTEFYGLSGEMDIAAATAAYLFAGVLNEKNRDLAYLAVIGAVGDAHDRGGRLVGENRLALDDAVGQDQIHIEQVNGREQYVLTRFGRDIKLQSFCKSITTLGAPGYYVGGPDLGIQMCLEGPFSQAEQKIKELDQIRQAAYDRVINRLRNEGLNQTKYHQWFSVETDFAPMGVKTIGEFCWAIRDEDFVDPNKYLVGFQIMDREVPGIGKFDWSSYKVSMRLPSPLEKKVLVDGTMPGLAYVVPKAAKQVGGSLDACHEYSGATIISVGRKAELIAAMDQLVAEKSAGSDN